MSTIKVNRALKIAAIGGNPSSASDMLAAIPAKVIAALTSRQLAEMLDATWAACQQAKALAARDVISEGVIWDARNGRLINLAH